MHKLDKVGKQLSGFKFYLIRVYNKIVRELNKA